MSGQLLENVQKVIGLTCVHMYVHMGETVPVLFLFFPTPLFHAARRLDQVSTINAALKKEATPQVEGGESNTQEKQGEEQDHQPDKTSLLMAKIKRKCEREA